MKLAGRLMFVLSGRNPESMLWHSTTGIAMARAREVRVAQLVTVLYGSRKQLAVWPSQMGRFLGSNCLWSRRIERTRGSGGRWLRGLRTGVHQYVLVVLLVEEKQYLSQISRGTLTTGERAAVASSTLTSQKLKSECSSAAAG